MLAYIAFAQCTGKTIYNVPDSLPNQLTSRNSRNFLLSDFALVSACCSPGFDFEDFVLGNKKDLLSMFPHCETIINKFCRT